MSAGRIAGIGAGIVLFVIGYIGLFPLSVQPLLADAAHMYPVGLSMTPEGWHLLGTIGGVAAVAGIWTLSAAFRRAH